mmetsp:Transcript_10806/g.29452  ORF Transcript_10806/g.29452 Transcript_10806/m.29452 type:complete len:227 (+) Transcript_10806:187-867(+)
MLCARDARRRPAASEQPRVEHARRRRSPARIHIKHAKNPPRPPTAKTRAGLLRHVHRRPAGGAHRDDAPRGRRPEDGRELPLPLHGREGHGPLGQAALLQGLHLPPRHHGLHVPGRRLHARQRHGRRVHLRREVRRRELPAPPHGPRRALDGQRRPGHERLPVLPLHGQDRLARRQARRLRLRDQGHGRRQEDRGRRLGVRRDGQAGRHHRLRPALSVVERATRTD